MLFCKKQQLVICLLGAIFVTDFVFFGYMPLHARLKDIEAQKNAQQAMITRAAAQRAQLPATKQQSAKLQAVVGNFEAAVPLQRDLGEFVQKVGVLMTEHDLKDQVIQPGDQVCAEGLNCIRISMQCKGNLGQIFAFFRQLQNMDRILRVEEVKLVTGGDFTGQISMEAKAVIYYQAQPARG